MAPLIDDDDAYEEAMLAIAKLRTDTNGSPHGAIGDRPRGATAAPGRPAPAHETLLHSPGGASSPLSLVDAFLGSASVAPLVRDLPTPPVSIEEEDPAFKNDLAHVLVWFTDDLSASQRLSAVYTLARHLSPTQQDLLTRCLNEGSERGNDESREAGKGECRDIAWLENHVPHQRHQWHTPEPQRPPSGLPSWPSNAPMGGRTAIGSTATTTNPASSLPRRTPPSPPPSASSSLAAKALESTAEDVIPVSAELFHADLPGWLRLHRLHKYEPALTSLDRRNLLALDGAALEALGVAALGARRKFTRLFGAIRQATTR